MKVLTIIIDALCSAVGIIIALCGLLTKNMEKKYYEILFITTFIVGIISLIMPWGQRTTIPVISFILIIIALGEKEHKIINLCFACLGYMIDVIFNQIVLYILNKFFGIIVAGSSYEAIFAIIYTGIFALLIILIRIIMYNKMNILKYINSSDKFNSGILINLICFVAIFVANVVMGQTVNYNQSVLLMNSVLFGLCFLSTSIVLIYFTKTIRSEEEKKADQERLKMTENYVSGLEQLIDESRELRHDYKNLIATISGFIEEDDMPHLKEYFDTNIRDTWVALDKKGKAWQSLKDVEPPELKGILYEKVLKAIAMSIEIRVIPDYELNVEYKNMKALCRLLGLLIDNAIEAAEESEKKYVDIRMANAENGYRIIIENTYGTKPELAHLYDKGYSTKGENRGYGMYYAREIILDNEDMDYCFEIQENVIVQNINIEI